MYGLVPDQARLTAQEPENRRNEDKHGDHGYPDQNRAEDGDQDDRCDSGDRQYPKRDAERSYSANIDALRAADAKQLTRVYFHFYPLFQQAYENLGYPSQYFNDRLIEVIDDMLKAPDVQGPIELVQPRVFFEYKDRDLEARSAGQKLLIRMGPANERSLKEKLRAFRAELVTSGPAGGAPKK